MLNDAELPGKIMKTGVKNVSLGCGPRKKPQFLRVDRERTYTPDILMDLEERWNFPPDWFRLVLAESIIEHVRDVPAFVNQCWDCLELGGTLEIKTPYWAGRWATGDPTHIHFFNFDSFNGWTYWARDYVHLNGRRRFKHVGLSLEEEGPGGARAEIEEKGFCRVLGMTFILKKEAW